MRSLKVSNFSCIEAAVVEFHPLTVIIGPQASGKSVLCKLGFFFQSLLSDQLRSVSERESFTTFKESTRKKFLRWFPIESWGDKKFEICFSAGEFESRITRTEYKGKLGQTFRIHMSEPFQKLYETSLAQTEKITNARLERDIDTIMPTWEVREAILGLQGRLLGADRIDGQLFVPAGRSFFTSIGRAIAVFEQSSTLDPLTIVFGRIFRSHLDRMSRTRHIETSAPIARAFIEMLGGELRGNRDEEHLSMKDGRKIPLSLLSSGQQELLPLLTVLPDRNARSKQLLYIEEPEAHLFPSAQSQLVQLLASLTNGSRDQTSLVITTHSPYVLAKFNNLILAGSLGRRRKDQVAKVVPTEYWIGRHKLRAYAIFEGTLHQITQKDGLIDADYLDDVSGEIGMEFERLLEIEAEANAKPQ